MLHTVRRLKPIPKALLALVAAIVLVAGGWFAWWTISPLFLNKTVSEALPLAGTDGQADELKLLFQGEFTGADAFHKVSGTARVVESGGETLLRFDDDFNSINGPDLYVWLVKGDNTRSDFLDLGRLKGNIGSQNYQVPEGTDLSAYDRVIIWCRAFSVLFGSAPLG